VRRRNPHRSFPRASRPRSFARPAALALALLAAAPAGARAETAAHGSPTPARASTSIFRFRLNFEPRTLDWNQGDVPILVVQNLMRGLYRVDVRGEVVPDLVESARTLEGGRRWEFTLRRGVRWSDGVELLASHATASLLRLLDPRTGSSYAYFLDFVKDARVAPRIRVLSDHRFAIELEHPVPHLPAVLTHWVTYPVRPDLLQRHPELWRNPAALATLGPYLLREWRPQLRMLLTPNPQAGQPGQVARPRYERVEGWIVADDATALNLYDSGQLEFIAEPGPSAAGHRDLTWRDSPIVYFIGLGTGHRGKAAPTHPLLGSRAGILALSAALDRRELARALGAPHRPALGFLPPEIRAAAGLSSAAQATPPGPADARRLLREAGFADGAAVPPVTLRFFNRPQINELAQWIQARWKRVLGIRSTLQGEEPKSYWVNLEVRPANFFLNSKGASYPDPEAFLSLFRARGEQNYGRWQDSAYEAALTEATRASTGAARRTAQLRAERRLVDGNPGVIPLYFRATGYLIKPYVRDLAINPLTSVDLGSAWSER
jgi:oligopeptide transport system substrate-binding protein